MATAAKKTDAAPENANLAIWNAVCRTDPKHTKRVNQRGGFTAIDAQYQIMEATRQFGPIGQGWGYIAGEPIFAAILSAEFEANRVIQGGGPWQGEPITFTVSE